MRVAKKVDELHVAAHEAMSGEPQISLQHTFCIGGCAELTEAKSQAIALRFKQMYPRLRQFFEVKTGNADDAMDLTQQLWLQMCEQVRRGFVPQDPEAYVFGSAYNLLKDFWRGEHSRNQLDGALHVMQLTPDLAPDTAECASSRELLLRIQAVLQTFPERTQDVFISHAVLGVSKQALAEQYCVDRSTIDRCFTRAACAVSQMRVRHRDGTGSNATAMALP